MATHKVAGIAYEEDGTTPLELTPLTVVGVATQEVLAVGQTGDGSPAVPGDSYFDKVSFLLRTNGANNSTVILEESPIRNALLSVGGTAFSTAVAKWGSSSISFNGSSTYLTFDTLNATPMGTGDFTIELWAYFTNVSGDRYLIDYRPAGNGPYPAIYLSGGTIRYVANSAVQITGSTSIATNTWYHIAVCRSGTSTKLFINGTQEGSTYSDSTDYAQSGAGGRPYIGKDSYGASDFFAGYIGELRVTRGYARYPSNFTAPTAAFGRDATTDTYWPYVVLLLTGQGANASTVFMNGAPRESLVLDSAVCSTTSPKYGSGSLYLPSNGSSAVWAVGSEMNLGSGDFTIEFWMKSSQTADMWILLYGQRNPTSYAHQSWAILGASGTLYLSLLNGTENMFSFGAMSGICDNTWHHIAATRQGTSVRCFVDGALISTTTFTGPITVPSTPTFLVGGINGTYEDVYVGYIDDLRITKGHARYTSAFTAPAAELPATVGSPYRAPGEFEIAFSYSDSVDVILHSPDPSSNDKVFRVTPAAL